MARNKFPGTCYRCGEAVQPGDGHFELFRGRFRVQHASCAIKFRGTPDPQRQRDRIVRLKSAALGTGKAAKRARKALREMNELEAPHD